MTPPYWANFAEQNVAVQPFFKDTEAKHPVTHLSGIFDVECVFDCQTGKGFHASVQETMLHAKAELLHNYMFDIRHLLWSDPCRLPWNQ